MDRWPCIPCTNELRERHAKAGPPDMSLRHNPGPFFFYNTDVRHGRLALFAVVESLGDALASPTDVRRQRGTVGTLAGLCPRRSGC